MEITLQESKRGTKVLLDTKHVKTIPGRYANVYAKVNTKMAFDKKRLNPNERNLLEIQFQYKKWLEKLSSNERCLFELVKNATPVAARQVKTPSGERMEIILDNNMKIATTSLRFFNLFPHTSTSYQNY